MFDAAADDLNKRRHVLGTDMLCTALHHNCQCRVSCLLSANIRA
jgi:hypothetical protein